MTTAWIIRCIVLGIWLLYVAWAAGLFGAIWSTINRPLKVSMAPTKPVGLEQQMAWLKEIAAANPEQATACEQIAMALAKRHWGAK